MRIYVGMLDMEDLERYRELVIEHDAMSMPNVQVDYEKALDFWKRWRTFMEHVSRKYEIDLNENYIVNYYNGQIAIEDHD